MGEGVSTKNRIDILDNEIVAYLRFMKKRLIFIR